MNDQHAFERIVADSVTSIGVPTPSDDAIEQTISRVGRKRQRPRWLALLKEPPMRTDSHLAVGSPTVRVVAILAATLLLALALAGAGVAGTRLFAAEAAIIVAQDGSGTFTTIVEAVARAEDGDEIHVRPGTYVESVMIADDIVLMGDGPREEIVIEAPEDGPMSALNGRPYGLFLVDSNAVVSGLTLRGQQSQLHIDGGSPRLSEMTFDGAGDIYAGDSSAHDSVYFGNGTTAQLRGSEVIASGSVAIHGLSEPVIADSLLRGGTNIYVAAPGEGALIEGNSIIDPASRAIGIWGSGPFTIKDNTIERADGEGIGVNSGSTVRIEGNTIRDSLSGITISGSDPTVTGNVITGSGAYGVSAASSDATITDNTIGGFSTGIYISGRSPEVIGNVVEGSSVSGILIAGGASPVVRGNTVCGSANNLDIREGAEPDLGENEICPDAPGETSG